MAHSGAPIVCVHFPRFELVVAARGYEALAGVAVAIAPTPGRTVVVGEVSGAAEAAGVAWGMPLGEALARCPGLGLLPGDPEAVARAWEAVARALESIGAAVELAHPGLAYLDASGLTGLYGGIDGVIAAIRRALGGRPVRIGCGPTRLCALAAALQARARRACVIGQRQARAYLASQPVELLSHRAQTAALVGPLSRLGITTLGELAALQPGAVSDRFGRPGLAARDLALGREEPLAPRTPEECIQESLQIGGSSSAEALERALDLLLERLLAQRRRRERTVRTVLLTARLVERGSWSERVTFRQATSDRRAMRLALGLRIALVPAPVEMLTLAVVELGPVCCPQESLLDNARAEQAARVREAVGQLRALAGPDAALRVAAVEPNSRIPERRFAFTPFLP
jgi:protein ImuB